MTALHPDHQRILDIAAAALKSRDDRTSWIKDTAQAAENHGYWCDQLWVELERQCYSKDSNPNVLEHPTEKRRRMIADLRREIVLTAMDGIEAALENLANGPMIEGIEE